MITPVDPYFPEVCITLYNHIMSFNTCFPALIGSTDDNNHKVYSSTYDNIGCSSIKEY